MVINMGTEDIEILRLDINLKFFLSNCANERQYLLTH